MPQTPVLVPLLNANEPEARLVEIHVKDAQPVQKGDLLFTIETTKAASDVESPESGFVRMVAAEGDTLAVGDLLALITASADEALEHTPRSLPAASPADSPSTPGDAAPAALRITKPARALAESLGLDLSALPTDRLVTEAVVRQLAGESAPRHRSGYCAHAAASPATGCRNHQHGPTAPNSDCANAADPHNAPRAPY